MIKNKMKVYYNKLIMMPTKNNFFQKYIRYQLIDILSWFIYPEFRDRNKFYDLIVRNKFMFLTLTFFILWTTGTFTLGRFLSFQDKKEQIVELTYKLDRQNDILFYTNQLMNRKDSTISQLREDMGSRDYLEYVIQRDCKLKHFNNLQNLSDEVFFTMIDEVEKYQIPYTIFFRIVDHESGFKFISNFQGSGAMGFCQVMPLTFRNVASKLGLSKHDEVNNIKTGAYILRKNFDIYRNQGHGVKNAWYYALVSYSGGNSELAKSEMKYFKSDL